ncbi:MAG: phosphate/phosphite/phosphonate ABC transporter substrate-binding protein [Nitrospirota bacterium]
MGKALIIIFLCLTVISGCSKTETISPEEKKTAVEEHPLLIGLIPEQNVFKQLERYNPLADYLSKKIGRKIELKVLTRYGNIIDNFVSLGLDGAFFGSFTYTMAHAKLGVEVLARPLSIDGTSTYHGLIFARKDSGIKTAKDMKGKTFAFVDKATTAGYLLPIVYFKKNGIRNYKAYLKETYFTGTHDDAIYDVLNRKADIGAAKNTVYFRLANIDSRIKNELVILERSPDVPENGLAVSKDLDSSTMNKLKEALLNMHNDAEGMQALKDFGAAKFIKTTDDDYANVYRFTKEINLNLATYDYMNE